MSSLAMRLAETVCASVVVSVVCEGMSPGRGEGVGVQVTQQNWPPPARGTSHRAGTHHNREKRAGTQHTARRSGGRPDRRSAAGETGRQTDAGSRLGSGRVGACRPPSTRSFSRAFHRRHPLPEVGVSAAGEGVPLLPPRYRLFVGSSICAQGVRAGRPGADAGRNGRQVLGRRVGGLAELRGFPPWSGGRGRPLTTARARRAPSPRPRTS
jgi:hypothetical protein